MSIEQEEAHDVYLYIYDLANGNMQQIGRQFGLNIDAIWHTSVIAYGKEFYFGSNGVQICEPGNSELKNPLETLHLGVTYVPLNVFKPYLRSLVNSSFQNTSYHLFNNNCNNFSQELANFLCGANIPDYILDLPKKFLNSDLGKAAAPIVEYIALSASNLPINQAITTSNFLCEDNEQTSSSERSDFN